MLALCNFQGLIASGPC